MSRESHMARAIQLVNSGRNINECNGACGDTLLHCACYDNDIETMRYLVEHGADVNYPNKYGNTPLHYTIFNFPNIDIIKLLLENGADKNKANKSGGTVLRQAKYHGYHDIVQFIESYDQIPTKGVHCDI
jgi:ankyrin repeat protein